MTAQKLKSLAPFVVFGVLAVYFAIGLTRDPHRVPSVLIDKPAPVFDLPALPGSDRGLATADLAAGKPQLLTFFASWCPTCREEQPVLMRLAREQGVLVRAIDYKDKPADALAWLARQGNPFDRIGVDQNGRVGIDFGVYGIPETFLIDGQGRIRYKHIGAISPDDVERTLLPKLRSLQ